MDGRFRIKIKMTIDALILLELTRFASCTEKKILLTFEVSLTGLLSHLGSNILQDSRP